MPPSIYPDLRWYLDESARKGFKAGRCPYANVLRCPRYYDSREVLAAEKETTSLSPSLKAEATAKWQEHALLPATKESETSIANGLMYSNFCPEVTGEILRLFVSSLTRLLEDANERAAHEAEIARDPGAPGQDWRTNWRHVDPMHYSECPLYAQLSMEKHVSSITFNAPVSGNVNIAGETVHAATLTLSISELLTRIDDSSASPAEKEAAKSRLAAFLSHPLVAAIVGGVAGGVAGGA